MSAKDLIIKLPNKHLRQKSAKVGLITEEVRQVVNDMKAATLDWEAHRKHELGVALAAIQIDKAQKIIIVRNNFDDKDDKTFSVFINPEIIKYEGEVEEDFEGCLSVTDVYGKVPRHSKIRLRALDEDGQQLRVRAEGFLARVFQHELDHLNGVLFIDHLKNHSGSFYKLTPEGKLEKIADEQVAELGILR